MSQRKPPQRGASRASRPAAASRATGRGGSSRAATAQNRGKAQQKTAGRRLRKGRLAVALLLVIGLVWLLWFVTHRDAAPAATVPPALAGDSKIEPGGERGKQAANTPAQQDAERFEFYDILPKQQVLPTRPLDQRPAPRARAESAGVVTDSRVMRWLQAGAFASPAEAETRRADIRQRGIPARISEVSQGGARLHRVLAGPFPSDAIRDDARQTLSAAGIDAIPLSTPVPPTGAATP